MSGRRANQKGRSEGMPRFVALPFWLLDTPAARDMSSNAFKLLAYMIKRFNGANNGKIAFGTRSGCFVRPSGQKEVVDLSIGLSKTVTTAALKELQKLGFIVVTTEACFENTKRRTREWRLTWLPDAIGLPTNDFAKITSSGPPEDLSEQIQVRPQTDLDPTHDEKSPYRSAGGPNALRHRSARRPHIVHHLVEEEYPPFVGNLHDLIAAVSVETDALASTHNFTGTPQ